MYIFSGVTVPV